MKTTDELLTEIVNTRKWYAPLGYSKQFAANIKAEFKAGTLSDDRKKDLLLRLGYTISQPILWEKV